MVGARRHDGLANSNLRCDRQPPTNLPEGSPLPSTEKPWDYDPPEFWDWLHVTPSHDLGRVCTEEDFTAATCDPEVIEYTQSRTGAFRATPEQEAIVDEFARLRWWAQNQSEQWDRALFFLAVLSLPCIWYFLLGRLSELRTAIGQSDSR